MKVILDWVRVVLLLSLRGAERRGNLDLSDRYEQLGDYSVYAKIIR